MTAVKVNELISVAGQPEPADFTDFAARGFAGVINARPDGEDPGQPGNAAEKAAAAAAGLSYSFVPVKGAEITEADIIAFRAAMADAKGPVLAHCKSGTRALTLYALGEALDGRMSAGEIEALGKEYGFDLSNALRFLKMWAGQTPQVKAFFHAGTSSVQYVVTDPATKRCVIIDPVLDFDETSGATGTASADAILAYIAAEHLALEWILDTHPHADHFSAAHYLKGRTGAPTAIGAHVTEVQALWKEIYNWPALAADGSQWDRLFADGDTFAIGALEARVMFSPGHTLASVTYLIGDAAFVHDTVFTPDSGTARTDFPGGSAAALWRSIQAILSLPGDTRLFSGHDYQPNGRHPRWESTVAAQKRDNPHISGKDEAGYVALRQARDRTLPKPKLMLHALQVNIRAGRLPEPEENGRRYLKIPLDAL
ncbi:bifunctional sulfur transferase/dioxygenase Blh [Rhizobium binae]|uniref:bifunctional sulfur transferase/dioxygenase Blh n=1 Tax=Rhizobium binae TaxID=1138190 RepID=UPI001C82BE25|nr:bifunctional sulfur transferase/dioxygenase Blh [Rhizobium binae]MBX4941832.1 TIGR01244 family phosphatase [Rhizobium binae]MBX4947847.1 TIGR01244 family phosphatase [Rhizobium binae]MBX4965739.1 TIGR01244 family phosphatase [Rhizobium binae]MBX4983740.1 TIGR01244 family phosphatase [Rhizobium binae]